MDVDGPHHASSLVGRDEQRGELRQLWAEAAGGRGRLAVLSGEAGMGKTHLAEDLCTHATSMGGAVIAWGSCPGSDAPALWPWRGVMRAVGFDLPSTRSRSRGLPTSGSDEAPIHETIVEALRDRFTTPGVMVIDDLHWADRDSLTTLRLLAGELRHLPVLLVVTVRPDEPTPTATEVRNLLADVASSSCSLHLRGLSRPAVTAMISAQTGRHPSEALATTIFDRTGGNPLFVRELVRLLGAEGAFVDQDVGHDLPLPPLMRDILLRRVGRLSARTRRVLDVAAVAGRRVSVSTLADAAEQMEDGIAQTVDEATSEDLVSCDNGVLEFEHDLIREALVDELSLDDRRRLHVEVAESLCRHGGPGSELSEIAGHLAAAVPLVSKARVAEMALRAGRNAMSGHAPGVAVAQLRRGLAIVEDDDPLATELHLELGAALATAGERVESLQVFEAAATSARSLEDVDALARAAVGTAGMSARPRSDPALIAILEEALACRAGRRDALSAEVMRSLAHALLFSDQVRRRQQLADDAIEVAREVQDADALAHALYVWLLVHETSTNFDERLARSDELLAVARSSGSREIEASALHHHARQMAEKGDYATYDADVAACDAIAHEVSSVPWRWAALVNQTMRAVMVGDFIEGERLGGEAFAAGTRAQNETAGATYGAHLMALRTWQGRLGELLQLAISSAGQYRELPAVWASLPYIRAEMGDLDQAAAELSRLVDDDRMRALPGAQSWPVAVAMLARAAHLTGTATAAEKMLQLLEPIGSRHIVGPYADCYFGPAVLYRGLCSIATGDLDTAVTDLRAAVSAATEVGAIPVASWAAAELIVTEHRRGDRQLEGRLPSIAASLKRLDMIRHLERLHDAMTQTADSGVRGSDLAPVEIPAEAEHSFTFEGGFWSISFAGTTIELDDTKGVRDLHRLISEPGVELHALELMSGDGGAMVGVSTQPVLDAEAKRSYRRRLAEVDEEIDDADRCADLARSERAQMEREAVLDQLRSAVGLGGRDRAIPAEPERARQAVRARIRYVLDKIERRDPNLHRHLRHSVSTGTFCVYRPEQTMYWRT